MYIYIPIELRNVTFLNLLTCICNFGLILTEPKIWMLRHLQGQADIHRIINQGKH